jgi:hypothetical protein
MRNHASHFFERGWCRFDYDPKLFSWVEAALPSARATLDDPRQDQWLRYQGTWFAGVNALPNDARGVVGGSGPLRGAAVDFIARELGLSGFDWDAAQVSICYPGYPQPMPGESPGRARFRRERDAAHVDGLLPEGPQRRRHLREYHGFILGIPMVEFDADASPFVVWEGSQGIMRDAFGRRFEGLAAEQWGEQDITEAYHAARAQAFAECDRASARAARHGAVARGRRGRRRWAHDLLLPARPVRTLRVAESSLDSNLPGISSTRPALEDGIPRLS